MKTTDMNIKGEWQVKNDYKCKCLILFLNATLHNSKPSLKRSIIFVTVWKVAKEWKNKVKSGDISTVASQSGE